MLEPLVRALLWPSIGPVVNVTVAVCARFHSSTACRYAVYVVEYSRPVTSLTWSIRTAELGDVQTVGASRPNAVCSSVGMLVSHVMCALDEVRPLTCTFVISSGSSGGGGVSVLLRESSGAAGTALGFCRAGFA